MELDILLQVLIYGSTNIFTDANCTTLIFWIQHYHLGMVQLLVTITPIIEPPGGHGTDAIEELGGHYVMVQTKFEPSDADATQVNDFRRVGIVKNPVDPLTNTTSTLSTARTTNAILMASGGSGSYQADEKITQTSTGAQGRVVEWDATNRILYYVQEKYAHMD